jgi:hypothetical protein
MEIKPSTMLSSLAMYAMGAICKLQGSQCWKNVKPLNAKASSAQKLSNGMGSF